MTDPLQEFGWKKSAYERPSDMWVCGQACDGTPCAFGPTSKGQCQHRSACVPKSNGREFFCQRPAHLGGKCAEGPLENGACPNEFPQCKPRHSLLYFRRIVVGLSAALSLAMCLLLWSGESTEAISPGPLTSHHASSDVTCQSCHTAATGDWTSKVLEHTTPLNDSALCMNCHTELGENPLLSHGLAAKTWETNNATTNSKTGSTPFLLQVSTALTDHNPHKKHACSECHQEHHGAKHDMVSMTNNQCQSCHQQQFESFEHGHPEFDHTPQPGSIRFDHAAHFKRYFLDDATRLTPDALAPTDCQACHQASDDRSNMLTRGFEQMCSACHERDIKDRDYPGIAFFQLPASAGDEIGEWPTAQQSAGTEIPGFMQLLLDGRPADSDWEIKELLHDIVRRGQPAIDEKLADNLKPFGQMEPSIISALTHAQQVWFPNLHDEITQHREGMAVGSSAVDVPKANLTAPQEEIGGGWYVRHDDLSVRYRTIGHADPIARLWLEQTLKLRGNVDSVPDADPILAMSEILANPTGSGSEAAPVPVASGRCLSCHAVTRDPVTSELSIAWSSAPTRVGQHSLTQFSHAPHVHETSNVVCQTCHALEDAVPQLQKTSPELLTSILKGNSEPSSITCGIHGVSMNSCIKCHSSQSKLDNCLQCHRYHAR
ncbi:MAG: hypothetical protein R3C18_02305 [Planctomycetaceae bacterium]